MSSGGDVFLKLSQVDSHIPVKFFNAPHLLILLINMEGPSQLKTINRKLAVNAPVCLTASQLPFCVRAQKFITRGNFTRKRHSSRFTPCPCKHISLSSPPALRWRYCRGRS